MVSCNQDKQRDSTSPEPESKKDIEGVNCDEFSRAMIDFIALLKRDNYEINPKENQLELSFKSYKEEFKVDKDITFPKDHFKTIFAKRKNKLERMEDNWYPSFTITEICFQNEQLASKSYQDIFEIIDLSDLGNEKNYDYLLQNGNRLIYVSCGAKIFETYALGYKDEIEGIIEMVN